MSGTKVVADPIKPAKEASRRSIVTDEHRAEAKKLSELFDAFKQKQKDRGVRITQAGFGETHHIGAQSVVWQYLNANIPLNLRVASAFAKGMGISIQDFSPRLAKELAAVAGTKTAPSPKTALQSVLELNTLEGQLLGLFRELGPEAQDEVMQLANKLHAKAHPGPSAANPYPAPPPLPAKRKIKEGAHR